MTDIESDRTPSTRAAKRIRTQQLWLDHFPLDICSRIASYLPSPQFTSELDESTTPQIEPIPPIIFLAEASEKQRRAVAVALSHQLRIDHINNFDHANHLVSRFLSILGHDIRKVHLPGNIGSHPEITRILALPTISDVDIPNLPSYTRAMISGASIKVLSLDITDYTPINAVNPLDLLPDLLRACPVEKARLRCHGCGHSAKYPCTAVEKLRKMMDGSSNSSLRSLHLNCISRHVKNLISAIALFPNLQEVTLEHGHHYQKGGLSSNFGPRERRLAPEFRTPTFEEAVRRLQSVRILHVVGAFELATRIGASVTTIATTHVFSSEDMAELYKCPNLTSLDIWVEKGAEASFPRDICSLRSLNLRWYLGDDDVRVEAEEENSDTGSNSSDENFVYHQTQWWGRDYYSPASGILLGLVQRNTQLEVLRLEHVTVARYEQEGVLEAVSGRLRELELPIYQQGVSASEQFTWLMRVIGKHNHALLQFHSSEVPADSKVCMCQVTRIKREIKAGLQVLQRRVPRLCGADTIVDNLRRRGPCLRPCQKQCDERIDGEGRAD